MSALRQFDRCTTEGTVLEGLADLVVVLQSDLVEHGHSTVVAPMFPAAEVRVASRLTPIVSTPIGRMLISIPELTSTDARQIGPVISNISTERDRIVAALDILFTGV